MLPMHLMDEVLGYLCMILGCPSTRWTRFWGASGAHDPVGELLRYLCTCWVSSGPGWHLRDEPVPPMPLMGEVWGCLCCVCTLWASS